MPEREAHLGRLEALAVLGLEAGAGRDEIRSAHRRLVRRYHPDAGATDALGRFLAVQTAYEALRDAPADRIDSHARRGGSEQTMSTRGRSAVHSTTPYPADAWRARAAASRSSSAAIWRAEPGWRGGAWYWEDIARRARARSRASRL